jgi:hypothetical protein
LKFFDSSVLFFGVKFGLSVITRLKMSSSPEISVVSYNLLSDGLCSAEFHLNAREDERIVDAERRFGLVLQKFDGLDNDVIICMQEVSRNWSCKLMQYFYDKNYTFIPSLYGNHWNGYMGVAIAFSNELYRMRWSDIKRIGDLVPKLKDSTGWVGACAAWAGVQLASGIQSTYRYFSGSKFKCLEPYLEEPFQNIAKKRYNTLLTVELAKMRESGESEPFCVSTYHMPCLFANHRVMITHALLALRHALEISDGRPLIFAGDFNTQPADVVYDLYCKGWDDAFAKHPTFHETFRFLPEFNPITQVKSAYAEIEGNEPDYTNRVITKHNPSCFEGTLDYIFYHGDLKPVSVIPLDCPKDRYFPNLEEPSDHLMIGSTFTLGTPSEM